MSILRRIRLFQLVVVLALAAIAGSAILTLRGANYYIERVQLSRRQADAMTELAIRANRFSENIAELLLIGEAEREEFEDARGKLIGQLEHLQKLSQDEDDLFTDAVNDVEERQEAERIGRMRDLVREIDRAVERVLLLDKQGDRAQAIALFRAEIENRFDKEFETLIADAVQDEREDVTEADATAQRLLNLFMIGLLSVLAVLVGLVLAQSVRFSRSLKRPIDALVEGARSVEQGNLAHRVAVESADEFGVLANRFNAMSIKLQEQRAALLAAQDTLERQVSERTQEIAEANGQLTRLDEQRVRFLGDISHELKTPLTVLRAEAELALRGATKPEEVYREALESIVALTVDLGELVDDLLFLARAEADEIRFEFRPVSLDGAVSQAVKDAALLSGKRGIHIRYACPKPSPIVRADPRRLRQALLVMLNNSARYAEAGTEVTVEVAPPEAGHVAISVRDRGPGIPPEEIPFVFERFYRGSGASAGAQGTGLGLPIARWIVEKHAGRVDLSSEIGIGTEIRMSLPVAA